MRREAKRVWLRASLCSTPPPILRGLPHMDLGRFEKSIRPSQRGGLDLGPFAWSNRPSCRGWLLDVGPLMKSKRASKRVETHEIHVNPSRKHPFLPALCTFGGSLGPLGGVGPWTSPSAQPSLLEGGLGPWAFQKVQQTLREGGVGPWTFKKSGSIY